MKHNTECSIICDSFGKCSGFYCSCSCHGDWSIRRILGFYIPLFYEVSLKKGLSIISGKQQNSRIVSQ